MIARASAIIAISACALLGSSTAASAEMVLARELMPSAQKTVKVKRPLRRSMRRAARRGASDQRGRAAVRATPPSASVRAAASPVIDTFAQRFDAAFPATKTGD